MSSTDKSVYIIRKWFSEGVDIFSSVFENYLKISLSGTPNTLHFVDMFQTFDVSYKKNLVHIGLLLKLNRNKRTLKVKSFKKFFLNKHVFFIQKFMMIYSSYEDQRIG